MSSQKLANQQAPRGRFVQESALDEDSRHFDTIDPIRGRRRDRESNKSETGSEYINSQIKQVNSRHKPQSDNLDDLDLDNTTINLELEQGRSQNAGKLQNALLKQSQPETHCQYEGQAARHINTVGRDFIITVNNEHKIDIFKRGNQQRVKELDIEYMRFSLVVGQLLFIGTEEKLLYMVDSRNFNIIDKI